MTLITILVAEDDSGLRQGLVDLLEGEGYRVVVAVDGREALERYRTETPDLLLLDVMMPGVSGYDVCREVRRSDPGVPIVMLTAKGEEVDKVVGLELGADDYITKPFGLHELRARLKAALRRRSAPGSPVQADSFQFGAVVIHRRRLEGEGHGRQFRLTARELALLELFHGHPGEVLSRDRLLNEAWGIDYQGTTRTLDQHIAQLRKKIEADPASPCAIQTAHGIGYRYAGTAQET